MRTLLTVEQHDLRLALELYLDQESGVTMVREGVVRSGELFVAPS